LIDCNDGRLNLSMNSSEADDIVTTDRDGPLRSLSNIDPNEGTTFGGGVRVAGESQHDVATKQLCGFRQHCEGIRW